MENSELSNLDDEITNQLARVRKHAPFDNAESYIIFLETLLRSMHKNQIESKKTDQERLEEHQRFMGELENLREFKGKFDKKIYDHNIFDAATVRYEHASKLNKDYGICLFEELKHRKMAEDGYDDTLEFLDMSNAYKTHRYDKRKAELVKKVKSTLPKK